jgi:hypothetical protein
VGISFATIGGLTASMVSEKVLDPIARIQNNLCDHLAADRALATARLAAMAPGERMRIRPETPAGPTAMERLTDELVQASVSNQSDSSPFRKLLQPVRSDDPANLAATPAVFLSAASADDLKNQLSQSHRHHPYIRAVLRKDRVGERLEEMLVSIIHGTMQCAGASGPVHLRGHIAASCTAGKLAAMAEAGEESLLGTLLWLADDDGVMVPDVVSAADTPAPYNPAISYAEALQNVWARRLDCRQPEPVEIRYDWEADQREWIAHLLTLQPQFPGLARAARPLFSTLVYGLHRLTILRNGEQIRWSVGGALALAKFLVMRMVGKRARIAQSVGDARIRTLAVKVMKKLEFCPLDERGIVRKSNRLLIADCRQALELCDLAGVVRRTEDDKWELLSSVAQATDKLRGASVDV